jgi:hypothetical protein
MNDRDDPQGNYQGNCRVDVHPLAGLQQGLLLLRHAIAHRISVPISVLSFTVKIQT